MIKDARLTMYVSQITRLLNVSLSTHLPCLSKLQGVGQRQRILKSTDSRPKIR